MSAAVIMLLILFSCLWVYRCLNRDKC